MQKKDLDVVALGEALIEFSRVSEYTYHLSCAGDVLNTVFYASRLGLRAGLVTATGQDVFEHHIRGLLDRERIHADQVLSLPGKKNGVYFIHLEEHGEPSFHFFRKESAATETLLHHNLDSLHPYIVSARVFLFSAIGLAVYKQREALASLLMRVKGETTVCFDTNFRASLWEDPTSLKNLIEDLAGFIDIIFVTDTDDRGVYGLRTRERAISYYHGLGIETVVFREGPQGAWGSSGGAIEHAHGVAGITEVDATGAGDAFNAGFLFRMLNGGTLHQNLAYGCATAAQVVQSRGGIVVDFIRDRSDRYYTSLLERDRS